MSPKAPKPASAESERLAPYRRKRSADRTPEPFGAAGRPSRALRFVVQQHAARRLHYDFRLEWRGVLLSWAVPRGPSLDPRVKRLAIRVEDHPVDYADFEGVIPKGNYGAGPVIVWDRGRWIPRSDPEAGLREGKLLFDLEGMKLRGRFTLVRTRRGGEEGREWLLIKKRDAHARANGEALDDRSVLSGLTLAERAQGSPPLAATLARLEHAGTPPGRVDPARVRPMLAFPSEAPFSRPGWLFEVKYDGYRVIAAREGNRVSLFTRTGRRMEKGFPEVAAALRTFPAERFVLDGELVVTDAEGRPRFQGLQARIAARNPGEAERAALVSPATLFAFDALALEDFDLRPLPLRQRREALAALVPERGPVRLAPSFEERGEEVYREVERLGLEGMVAKRADAPYRSGRSRDWRKIRRLRSDDFVIVGFTSPRGSRSGFGALHLAAYDGDRLVYTGRVGSGFPEADLAALRARLDALRRDRPPCGGPLPRGIGHHWVEPELVCEVRYAERTRDGLLRQPVFVRLRPDKPPGDCRLPDPPEERASEDEPEAHATPGEPRVPFSNLDKVFWPEDGLTKRDLIDYTRAISPWLLPYLEDRPLVLTRYPDGIHGKSFFQKDAPRWIPDWIRVERMWSEHAQREIHYFVCDDLDSLLYVVNLGTIPLHVWSSRVSDLAHPDWCILDLDPKGAPMRSVVRVARFLHEVCDEIGLPTSVKTSGSEGLHVLLPLGRQLTYEQSRTLAELLARLAVEALPDIATVARATRARGGRVYVDALQNGHGRLLVAPYSPRPLPSAPVSMPLFWREVNAGLRIDRFTLRNAPRRMRRLGEDPMAPVRSERPDLERALARLERRVGRG